MDKNIINVPNALTVFRFPAGIAILWLLLQYKAPLSPMRPSAWISILIGVVALFAFLSDYYDGKLARKNGIVTNFGKMLDPVADSMLFTLLLLGLALSPRFNITIWFTVIMLYREAGVQIMRRYAAVEGVVLMAGWAGKAKMFIQCIVMGVLGIMLILNDTDIFPIKENYIYLTAWWGSALSALSGLISLFIYIKQLPKMIRQQREKSH